MMTLDQDHDVPAHAETLSDADAHHEEGLFQSAEFHVALGFFIFVALLLWLGVHRMIAKALDERAARIGQQIDEARALREEAQAELARNQRRQREIEADAENIIGQAEEDARLLLAGAQAELERLSARKRELADQKIARAEEAAILSVRNRAVDIAIVAAREVIAEELSGKKGANLLEDAIRAIPAKAH